MNIENPLKENCPVPVIATIDETKAFMINPIKAPINPLHTLSPTSPFENTLSVSGLANQYKKYFIVRDTPKRGREVIVKDDVLNIGLGVEPPMPYLESLL